VGDGITNTGNIGGNIHTTKRPVDGGEQFHTKGRFKTVDGVSGLVECCYPGLTFGVEAGIQLRFLFATKPDDIQRPAVGNAFFCLEVTAIQSIQQVIEVMGTGAANSWPESSVSTRIPDRFAQ
jgi:hypothetical protein